ncbi:MAP7 domain-containing protein 2-like isoform X2 [Rhopalosiphum maidis]|uniref:MAP7 domain-containing protein 2-like isoform X2 n=1 Tax=Rhopalosiphum maidis TaxID=43146 RepID=UPI000EFE5807|nr:MAP7 domain-containing protein 2-like isoform X2 [Rhopalosiphum maidis]XP_026820679.1 MAP7 domain-containing protein 2-like isoform X2 [Rhopalosiphum maidis]
MAGLLRVPHYRHSGEDSRRTGPEEGIDNLLLVPESVLDMDGNQLRDDLNGLRFAFRKQYLQADLGPQGNIWISGVTTVNSDNRPSTAPTPPQNSSRAGGLHWFAHGADSFDFYDETDETGKENAIKDREERLRLVREKHDEERQRKLDELKQQALAVQRYREQKEEERRRRLDEMRLRDTERRQQVEERKRQLFEAEREKRDAILKKNLEREARIVSKRRNERSSIVFAFGSSTPRMLEPSETGGSYWASRRATSTSNVMMLSSTTPMGPLTRRSSERELNECSGKKRAASAGGLSNRSTDEYNNKRHSVMGVLHWSDMCYPVIPEYPVDVVCEGGDGSAERKAARRKTDLMPTIVSPRDLTPCSRPGSSSSSRRSPGRASSMTRLDGAATAFGGGCGRLLSSARSMSHLASGGGGGRSVVLGANKDRSTHHRSMIALNPVPPPRPTRAERLRKRAREFANGGGAGMKSGEMTPNRPQSSMSQSSTGPLPTQPRSRPVATPRKPRPISIAVTGVTSDQPIKSPATGERPPLPKVNVTKKSITPKVETKKFPNDNTKLQSTTVKEKNKNAKNSTETPDNVESSEQQHTVAVVPKDEDSRENSNQGSVNDLAECDMTASMLATKQKISTEEEAKAALAERRKLAREQAERDAELERQRLEAERLAEEERLRCEEEEQRRQEEEQLRMLEEARKSEELRLQLAIEETKKREEEEKKRKEEEHKLKLEKEEADRKAKEEAEKLRQEMEIKLKKEEEDRQLRRKRVEAIMLRTRNQGKGNASTKEETESAEQQAGENKTEKPSSDPMTTSQGPVSETEAMLTAERVHSSSSTTSSASSPTSPPGEALSNGLLPVETSGSKQNGRADNSAVHQSNGCLPTANGGTVFNSEVQLNNVTNNLLDLSLEPIPSDALSTQQIIDIGMKKCIQDNTTEFTTYQETNRSEQQIVNDLLS